MKEELLEPTDLCLRTGVDHKLRDTGGDERHNVVAQHKRRTILAKRSLGVISLLEHFIGPSDSIRTRRSRTGNEVFRAPRHLNAHSPRCNLVRLVISIIAAKEGVKGATLYHINKVQTTQSTTRWTDRWELERFRGVVLLFQQVSESKRAPVPAVETNSWQQNKYMWLGTIVSEKPRWAPMSVTRAGLKNFSV